VQAEEFLTHKAVDEMLMSLRKLLNWMNDAVASDLEVLSDKGQDRMFVAASNLMEKVHVLLTTSSIGSQEAEELVRLSEEYDSPCSLHLSWTVLRTHSPCQLSQRAPVGNTSQEPPIQQRHFCGRPNLSPSPAVVSRMQAGAAFALR